MKVVATALLLAGLETWVRLVGERLDRLEERGMVPVDDLVTVGDLIKLRAELAGVELDDPQADEDGS